MMQSQKITLCACASRTFITPEKVAQLAAILEAAGKAVEIVPDLCEWIENKSDRLKEIATHTVVACHPRAIKALFEWAEQPVPHTLDMRANDLSTLLTALDLPADSVIPAERVATFRTQLEGFSKQPGQDAWFPTIDKSRCIECGKCVRKCPMKAMEQIEGDKR